MHFVESCMYHFTCKIYGYVMILIDVKSVTVSKKGLSCAIASQESLSKRWDTPEEDAAWDYLKNY